MIRDLLDVKWDDGVPGVAATKDFGLPVPALSIAMALTEDEWLTAAVRR